MSIDGEPGAGAAPDLARRAARAAPGGGGVGRPDADRLFLHALRNLVLGPAGWQVAQQEIWQACSISNVELVLGGFERLVACAATGARRQLRVLPPAASAVSPDELALMNLLAALQRGAGDHAGALVRWLVLPPSQERLMAAATRLASGLADGGHRLAMRRADCAPGLHFFRSPPGQRTLR